MADAAANHLDVNPWTVNETEYMTLCCQMGVNAIITNYPDKCLEIARRFEKM
jgi:glycerophosphoryl diester phosphodiesterase